MKRQDVTASGGDSAESEAETAIKRPRISSLTNAFSNKESLSLHRSRLTLVHDSQEHPMAVLNTICAKLQSTVDPHLQARLLLEYSTSATSLGTKTTAAIDFLFSFLQEKQSQPTALNDKKPSKVAGGSGTIVVGAIVRGLRHLLSVKPAVVEPMIQVDAMGEQLMQCMSVGEDFKLRREMLRIVVDCLLCTEKFDQLKGLLHTCVEDHDAGMQAICLETYLRLNDRGQSFVSEPRSLDNAALEHFDRLTSFVLFAQCDEVRVLAAQVLVTLVEWCPHCEAKNSRSFPSSAAEKIKLCLPEKTFYVLCLAANDASILVRMEVVRCLRQMACVLAREVVEHALVKTQIDEAAAELPRETEEMKTRRMMSSGVLLSLLEDVHEEVAAEASRTIVRLSEVATASGSGPAQWSQRVLERTITAHFDVLPRASRSRTLVLRQVFVTSLGRLLLCRHKLGFGTDFTISSTDLTFLLRIYDKEFTLSTAADTLHVLQFCDLSTWVVQRLINYVLKTAALYKSFIFDDEDEDYTLSNCWKQRLLSVVRNLGNKCSKVLQADVAMLDRLKQEAHGRNPFVACVCQALLGHIDVSDADDTEASTLSPPARSNLSFLQISPPSSHVSDLSSQATELMNALQQPPVDGNIVASLEAIHRLRTLFNTEESFQLVDILLRLRQHLRSFPKVSATPPSTPLKYVPISAMLSTSPSLSSDRTNKTSGFCRTQRDADAFASLKLSIDLQKSCQDMIDVASGLYIKAFALSSLPRIELLQLIMLGRVGLVLASLQKSSDSLHVIEMLQWVAKEATRLPCPVLESEPKDREWTFSELLSDVSSLIELKRAFVAIVQKTWPTVLIKARLARCTPAKSGDRVRYRRLSTAHASITEPKPSVLVQPEPREITANWPFEQRVRFVLKDTRDVSQVYVKSMLPNGDDAYHHVPVGCIQTLGPRKHLVVHTIMLTVSPFSDPTAFSVAVCLGHLMLPGGIEQPSTSNSTNTTTQMYTEISTHVRVLISHRTSSTLRHVAAKSSTAGDP